MIDYTFESFFEILINFLIEGSSAGSKDVRIRCVQILSLYLKNATAVKDDLLSDIVEAMKIRMMDKNAQVRIQAVTILCRLQVLMLTRGAWKKKIMKN